MSEGLFKIAQPMGPGSPAASPASGAPGPAGQAAPAGQTPPPAQQIPQPAGPAAGPPTGDDIEQLQQHVLDEAYRQHPYLGHYQVEVEWKKNDPMQGFFVGQLLVSRPPAYPSVAGAQGLGAQVENEDTRQREEGGESVVRVPVIVAERKLKKMDIFLTRDPGGGATVQPLSEDRLMQALQTPVNTTLGGKNTGAGGINDAPGVGTMLNPPSQSWGGASDTTKMGEFGMGQMGPPPDPQPGPPSGAFGQMQPTAEMQGNMGQQLQYPDQMMELQKNKALRVAAMRILRQEPMSDDTAADLILKNEPTQVVELSPGMGGMGAGGAQYKSASARGFNPETVSISAAAAEANLDSDIFHKLACGDTVLVCLDPLPVQVCRDVAVEQVKRAGYYGTVDTDGRARDGLVIPEVVDFEGQPTGDQLFLDSTTQEFGLQKSAAFLAVGEVPENKLAQQLTVDPVGFGCFIFEKEGNLYATQPMTAGIKTTFPDGASGHTASIPLPQSSGEGRLGLTTAGTVVKTAGLKRAHFSGSRRLHVPDSWNWLSLGDPVALEPNQLHFEKRAAMENAETTIQMIEQDDSFHLYGLPVQGLPETDRLFLKEADARFLLATMGADEETSNILIEGARSSVDAVKAIGARTIEKQASTDIAAMEKRAAIQEAFQGIQEAFQEETGLPWGAYLIKTAGTLCGAISTIVDRDTSGFSREDRTAVKVAAGAAMQSTVDSTLGLGLMSPDNLEQFADGVDDVEKVVRMIAEMLLASRMGALQDIDEGTLERSMQALRRVATGLHELRARLAHAPDQAQSQV
jgi:hypothetical protein